MIEINDISKVFRTSEVETIALNHVNIEVKEGEFVAIMGPSGCGKSTLLNILTGMDHKTKGKVVFNNSNIKLGYMLQSDSMLPWKKVIDNALLGLEIKKEKTKENITI